MKPLALDMGSGHNPVKETGWWSAGDTDSYEFVTLDLYHEADVRWDLDVTPYPLRDDSFDAVFARHSLEHVQRPSLVSVMREIHRIAKDGALVHVRVPYWNSTGYPGDPTHMGPFNEDTFARFCIGSHFATGFYAPKLYRMLRVEYRFRPEFAFLPKRLLRWVKDVLCGVCDELWVLMQVVKGEANEEYSPERVYRFDPYGIGPSSTLRRVIPLGAAFYGTLGVLSFTVLRVLGLL